MKFTKMIMILLFALSIIAVYRLFRAEAKEKLNVKVLSIKKCTATPPTIEFVRSVAKEMNIGIDIHHVIVATIEEAQKERFIGSPTVQINDLDIDPDARSVRSFGLT